MISKRIHKYTVSLKDIDDTHVFKLRISNTGVVLHCTIHHGQNDSYLVLWTLEPTYLNMPEDREFIIVETDNEIDKKYGLKHISTFLDKDKELHVFEII